jgi:hypothetical protein
MEYPILAIAGRPPISSLLSQIQTVPQHGTSLGYPHRGAPSRALRDTADDGVLWRFFLHSGRRQNVRLTPFAPREPQIQRFPSERYASRRPHLASSLLVRAKRGKERDDARVAERERRCRRRRRGAAPQPGCRAVVAANRGELCEEAADVGGAGARATEGRRRRRMDFGAPTERDGDRGRPP